MGIFIVLCAWLLLCVLVAVWAARRGRGAFTAFGCAVLFSPLVMWLVHLAIGPKTKQEATRRCPACAELVLADAWKCKHCGHGLDPTPMRDSLRDDQLRI